jgi:hypothetical protein
VATVNEDQSENPEIEQVDDQSVEDDEGLFRTEESSLSYFGADFDVRGLVQRLNDGDIIIPRFDPDESGGASLDGFQRQRVWTKPKMEKFIESLLLGWPVPSIFLVLDSDQRYLVLDGQQRLTALENFFSGKYPDGRDFVLTDVAEHLQGASYGTLAQDSRRRLNNTFIQATVIEPKGADGPDSVYRLFGRLNSGGVSLTAQEIRVALFLGPAIDWVRDLNRNQHWRNLYGNPNPRLKDHELVLRCLAMQEVVEAMNGNWADSDLRIASYQPPMSEFLNGYLRVHRNLKNGKMKKEISAAFDAACEVLFKAAGKDGLRVNGRINAAHVDATVSSLMWLARSGRVPATQNVRRGLTTLRDDKRYVEYVTRSTSHRENVYGRLQLALTTLSR